MARGDSFHEAAVQLLARLDLMIEQRARWCRARGYVASCECGPKRHGWTAEEWAGLDLVGTQDGVELRNCPDCRSTISHAMQAAEERCPETERNDR